MATPPDFTSGAVLTAAHMNAVGLWLVKTQSISAGVASVAVTSAFSSDFNNYQVLVSNGATSIGIGINVTLGAANTGYYSSRVSGQYTTTGLVNTNNNNGPSFTTGLVGSVDGMSADMMFFDPFLTKRTMFKSTTTLFATAGDSSISTGFQNSATSFTSFTMTPALGTFTSGIVYVYGYRK